MYWNNMGVRAREKQDCDWWWSRAEMPYADGVGFALLLP